MNFCSNCHTSFEGGSFCPVCGQPVQPAQPEQPEQPQQWEQQTPVYPASAVSPEENVPYADSFETPGNFDVPAPAPKKDRPNRTPVIVLVIVLVAVLAIGGGVIAYLMLNRDEPTDRKPSTTGSQIETQSDATTAPTAQDTTKPAETQAPTQAPQETAEETKAQAVEETQEQTTAPAEDVPLADAFVSAKATSTLSDQTDSSGKTHHYGAENVLSGDLNTCWSTDGSGAGESITLNFAGKRRVHGLTIISGYAASAEQYDNNAKPVMIFVRFSDGNEEMHTLDVMPTDSRSIGQKIEFGSDYDTESITIVIMSIEEGAKYEDTCITYIAPL